MSTGARSTGIRRIVLVGPGHTHLEILRRQILHPLPAVELIVVAPDERHHYSGMVPGYLYGAYAEGDISVAVTELVERGRGRAILASASGLDPGAREIELADGSRVSYDLVSIAVGSTTVGFDRPEIARHASLVKPLGRVVTLRDSLRRLALKAADGERREHRDVAVVGAGAAGIEVALAVQTLLGDRGAVRIYEAGDELLPGVSSTFRHRVRQVLDDRGIEVQVRAPVARVEEDALVLEDGTRNPACLTIWLTGAVAYPWLRASGLPVDDRGFLLVDRALRSIGDPRVFAAGDCATLEAAQEVPKAGVYAVRHGPVLWSSLRAALGDGSFPEYHPQEDFLALLNTADGKALLRWKGWVSYGRHAWWLKDWIDRRFLRRYQRLV